MCVCVGGLVYSWDNVSVCVCVGGLVYSRYNVSVCVCVGGLVYSWDNVSLCVCASQEWQNSIQKNAGLAFIELVNEGR